MTRSPAEDGPREIEVKLGVTDPTELRAVLAAPDASRLAGFRSAGPLRTDRVEDRYFDTADSLGRLASRRMRARLRIGGGEVILAVKVSGVESGALSSRREFEGPATIALDPSAWPESAARTLLLDTVGDEPLVEIARLRQVRLVRPLVREETHVELSLDDIEALDGSRVVGHRWELEAELRGGIPSALEELGEALERLPGIGLPQGQKLAFALAARRASAGS